MGNTVESSTDTGSPTPNRYPHLRSWKPGQSGRTGYVIPSSRLKLAMQVRKLSGEGRKLIDFLFSIVRGEPLPLPGRNGAGRPPRPSPELRVRAAEMLLDRGWGKAKRLSNSWATCRQIR
jgi:hypothetical protein